MLFLQVIAAGLLIAGIALLLRLTPTRIADDVDALFYKKHSLRGQVELAKGTRKLSRLRKILDETKLSLKITKRESQFSKICIASFLLFIVGMLISFLVGNVLLMPILSVLMALLPYLYIRRVVKDFNRRIKDELETALSIITSSYLRTEDIIKSISENIDNIKQPVKEVFKEFLGQTLLINSNITLALETLKGKLDNTVFAEWCDTMIACQADRSIKDTLQSITEKLTDIRIVNAKLDNLIMIPRKDFFAVLALTILNFPLIFLLNKDWFAVLSDTTIGKVVIAVTAVVAVITTVKMFKVTKPIEYKK